MNAKPESDYSGISELLVAVTATIKNWNLPDVLVRLLPSSADNRRSRCFPDFLVCKQDQRVKFLMLHTFRELEVQQVRSRGARVAMAPGILIGMAHLPADVFCVYLLFAFAVNMRFQRPDRVTDDALTAACDIYQL